MPVGLQDISTQNLSPANQVASAVERSLCQIAGKKWCGPELAKFDKSAVGDCIVQFPQKIIDW